MVCDLCKERSDQIIRVASWGVCQWCVSNHVLEHALEVEIDIAKLREAVAQTSTAHERDVISETAARNKLEQVYTAYGELTTAMKDLETKAAISRESLRQGSAAQAALKNYKDKEERRTRKARQHA
jgi:hypothetical protein